MFASKKLNGSGLAIILAAIGVFSTAFQAGAGIIYYTFTGVGSGSLNGHAFVNATYTISSSADTSQITSPLPEVFSVTDLSSSITIAGLGTATFKDPTMNVLNQNNISSEGLPAVGFADITMNVALIFESNPTFGAYNLGASEPLTAGSSKLSPNNTFATSLGNLSLTSVSTVNYSAAVPETTSTFRLLGLSAAAMFLLHRKCSLTKAA